MALPEFTMEEVAAHNSSDSLWLAIENNVYDVTNFFQEVKSLPFSSTFSLRNGITVVFDVL